MNKKPLSVFLLFIVICACVVAWLMIEKTNSVDIGQVPENQQKKKSHYLNEELKKARESGDPKKIEEIEKKITEQLPDNIRKAAKLAEQASFDIAFYGKVIDQNNAPVAGAKIEYSSVGLWNLTQGSRGEVVTDKDGMFVVNAKGNKLFVSMPRHQNIAEAYEPTIVNGAVSELPSKKLVFEAGQGVYDSSRGWDSYSVDNPYIMKVWRVIDFVEVKHKKTLIRLSPDNKVHTFILNKRRNFMVVKKGSDLEGDLLMRCVRDVDGMEQKNGSWEITIEAIDGGIQETNDHYLYEAPADGYLSALKVGKEKGREYGSALLANKKYYYTAHHGKVFGSLKINFEPYLKKKTCGMFIDYKINANGSRNLAIPGQN